MSAPSRHRRHSLALILLVVGGTSAPLPAQEGRALSPEQLEQFRQRNPEADANKDGKLTTEEARAFRRKGKAAPPAGTPTTPPADAAAKPAEDGVPDTDPSFGAAGKTYDRNAGPKPDFEDVPYGEHERLKLDLWTAKSDQSTPILVFFHGGGGDKLMWRGNKLQQFCLDHGISVAAVNFRPNNQFPFPVPMQDAARSIQFLRSKAEEYHLDPKRIGASGTSLGANVSIWIACHDDLVDPKSDDPVLRQSTRLSFVISGAGQTFNDMELFREKVYPYGIPGAGGNENSSEKAHELSAIYHVTPDDPPIFMTYGTPLHELPLPKDTPRGELIHNPAFGLLMKEKLDAAGIENHFYHGGNKAPAGAQEEFVLKQFFGATKSP